MYTRVVRYAGVVPLLPLLCGSYTARVFLNFRESVDPNCPSLYSRLDALIIRTHAHTTTVRSCRKTTTLKYRQCFTMAATASKAYRAIQARQQRRQHSKNEQEQYQKFYMVY